MKPIIGISACLTGQQIRFNGSSLKHGWIVDTLTDLVEFVPICPEVAMGLGTPRSAMRLVRTEGGTRLKEVNSDLDLTESAVATAERVVEQLPRLDGYVFAAKSPTCGLERVKVYTKDVPFNDGVGIFAEKILAAQPELLVIDSGRLHNEELRELFVKGLFAIARFNRLPLTRSALQAYHRQHKFSFMAHNPGQMRELGQIAANGGLPVEMLLIQYRSKLVKLLRIQPSKGGLINALQHMYGFLKHSISSAQKVLFFGILEKYRNGELAASVPLKMLQILQAGAPSHYLSDQYAWQPVDALEVRHVI